APNFDFYDNPRKPGPIDAGAVQRTGTGTNRDFTVSPAVVDFGFIPVHSPTTTDQDIQVINSGNAPLSFNAASFAISCTNVTTGCNTASFSIQTSAVGSITVVAGGRSEERRVGKECRWRW